MKLLNKIKNRRKNAAVAEITNGLDRREFLGKALTGAAVITTTWLATDIAYERYGSPLDESWLEDYYKSDFVGV